MARQNLKYFTSKAVQSVSVRWNPNPARPLLDVDVFLSNGKSRHYRNVVSVGVHGTGEPFFARTLPAGPLLSPLYKLTLRPSTDKGAPAQIYGGSPSTLFALYRGESLSSPPATAFLPVGFRPERGVSIEGGQAGITRLTVTVGAYSGGGWEKSESIGSWASIPALSGIDALPEPLDKVPTWVWVVSLLVGWGYLADGLLKK